MGAIMNKDLKNSILELREIGWSYAKIAEKLKCSKSTIAYYCNNTTKEKSKNYKKNLQENKDYIYLFGKHVDNFKQRLKGSGKKFNNDWNKKFRTAVSFFRNRNKMNVETNYTYKEALEHLGGLQTKCYLTGIPINIEFDDYCLDHIIPVNKGGTNELNNMGITIPSANASKSNLTLEEFLNQSKLILENFGYIVTKSE